MRALQIDRWVATLAEAGQSRTESDLTGAFAANWEVFEERWRTNAGPWGAADSVGFVGDHLGLEMSDGLRTALVENFRIVGRTAELHPAPGVRACLEALRANGCALRDRLRRRAHRLPRCARVWRVSDCWSSSTRGPSATRPAGSSLRPRRSCRRSRASASLRRRCTRGRQRAHRHRRRQGVGDGRGAVHGAGQARRVAPRAAVTEPAGGPRRRRPGRGARRPRLLGISHDGPSRVVRVWLHQRS